MTVGIAEIERAAVSLEGRIERTPCVHSQTLSAITGADVALKLESLQFTASFKDRGAANRLLTLSEGETSAGAFPATWSHPRPALDPPAP